MCLESAEMSFFPEFLAEYILIFHHFLLSEYAKCLLVPVSQM